MGEREQVFTKLDQDQLHARLYEAIKHGFMRRVTSGPVYELTGAGEKFGMALAREYGEDPDTVEGSDLIILVLAELPARAQ